MARCCPAQSACFTPWVVTDTQHLTNNIFTSNGLHLEFDVANIRLLFQSHNLLPQIFLFFKNFGRLVCKIQPLHQDLCGIYR